MKNLADDKEFLEFIGRQESQFLQSKDRWRDEVADMLAGNVVMLGDFLPWSKTHTTVRLRPGEVSVWAGINGHGRSGAERLSERVVELCAAAGLPGRLGECGVDPESLPAMAEEAAGQWTAQFNPREVASADLRRLYEEAL